MGFYEVMVLVLLFAIFVTLLSAINVLPVKVKTDEDEGVEVVSDVSDISNENVTSKEYEEVRLKREEEFDNRIRNIKAELEQSINTPFQVKRTGNIPDISDGIYNLPHGDVKDGYDNDGYEEISE